MHDVCDAFASPEQVPKLRSMRAPNRNATEAKLRRADDLIKCDWPRKLNEKDNTTAWMTDRQNRARYLILARDLSFLKRICFHSLKTKGAQNLS